ncbi:MULTISPECIES: metal ABC transporter solute-binding protein, Zn/Mn family [unclassified Gemella]|uniref:metal ABC transporter solute-binding protein, Zn/Mn family n=1 Tax=unclassified Gemella TaxID=2624949 RepID=UPI001C05365B|nr:MULTISPECIES: zinc ABC transporter substrate-binding protein [unclassified Gemella]MBU0279005.1 zinc ABC transporter substrate-binding protein [Gemella sp. zg-1178]QWQ38731.1 zinc ABC transporter substrate-binding protein [Gemella sp. zg-570]
MKKKLNIFMGILLSVSLLLVGCSKNTSTSQPSSDKKIIYTSFFPVYDLTKQIVGDKMEIKNIIKGNQEPHDFELQTKDMKEISKADLIIFNGANMENFIDDLKMASKQDDKFLDLSQGLTLLESGSLEENSKNEHLSINPHTWLSVKNALIELDTIYKKVASIDPANEAYYKKNLEVASKNFKQLDEKFEKELAKVKNKEKYFVVSHAAFNYLANDYGLKQVAITGISPEDEPSAKQLKTIADFVEKHNIKTIFFEGKTTPKVAQTLAKNTNTKTSTLYTMENLTDDEVKLGYIKLMEMNLEALVSSFDE